MGADTTLSKEEEEAYMNDYGSSYDELPDIEGVDAWEHHRNQSVSSEAASLLDHDGLGHQQSQNYMTIDDSRQARRNPDPGKKSPG